MLGNIGVYKVALCVGVQALHCTLSMFSPSNNCYRSCEKLAIPWTLFTFIKKAICITIFIVIHTMILTSDFL